MNETLGAKQVMYQLRDSLRKQVPNVNEGLDKEKRKALTQKQLEENRMIAERMERVTAPVPGLNVDIAKLHKAFLNEDRRSLLNLSVLPSPTDQSAFAGDEHVGLEQY